VNTAPGASLRLHGHGTALGGPCRWSLDWACGPGPLGASFAETVHACDDALTLRSGHDASTSVLWQTDLCGTCSHLQPGDDARFRSLVATLVRTGQWVAAVHSGLLHAELHGAEGDVQQRRRRAAVTASLALRLAGGTTAARLVLDPVTWTPRLLTMQLHSGGVETWSWGDNWPLSCTNIQSSGQETHYIASGPPLLASCELAELLQPPPDDVSESPWRAEATHIPAARVSGGVFAVRASALAPTAPGVAGGTAQEGWFVLDPCCDGAAVAPWLADGAAWPAAGEQKVHALGGAAAGPLRQGALALGPCVLPAAAWYQSLALDGAVTGIPHGQPLAGILGMAVLRRCVLEVRAFNRLPGGSRDAPRTEVVLHEPGTFADASDRVTVSWQRLRLLDGAPHVECTLRVSEDMEPFCGWFRLGLGVGGTAVVLSAATCNQVGFVQGTHALQPSGIMTGPGEQQGRFQPVEEGSLLSGRVASVELRGASFARQRCVVHCHRRDDGSLAAVDVQDMQLSKASAGVLCADLFRGCTLLLDVAGERCAVVMHS
jgi:hypothetical protein